MIMPTYRVHISARPRSPASEIPQWEPLGYVDVRGENEHEACEFAKVHALAKWHGSHTDLSISKITFLRD